MDIDEIRRQNILTIEKEIGSPKLTADRVGMTYAQYVNLRDGALDSRSGKPRGMRKETAWRFDDAGGKPRGWLDQDHSAGNDRTAIEPTSTAAHPKGHEAQKQSLSLVVPALTAINDVATAMRVIATALDAADAMTRKQALPVFEQLVADPAQVDYWAERLQHVLQPPKQANGR